MKNLTGNINRIIVLCLTTVLFLMFSCEKDEPLILEPIVSFQISLKSSDSKIEYPDAFIASLVIDVIDGNIISDSIYFVVQDNGSHRSKGNIEVPIDKRFVIKISTEIDDTYLFSLSDTLEIVNDVAGATIVKMFLTQGLIVINDPEFSSITETTAVLSSEIIDNGGYEITSKGFTIIEDGPTATADDEIFVSGSDLGVFETSVDGLLPGTTYIVKAFAENSNEYVESSERNFTTLNSSVVLIETSPATSITPNSAVVSASFISDGAQIFVEKGFVWATSIAPDILTYEGISTEGAGNIDFTTVITGLFEGTEYYVVSYATNDNGDTFYGNQISFTTPLSAIPVVSTVDVTVLLHTALVTVDVTDEGSMPVASKGVVYSTSPDPTIENNEGQTDNGTGLGNFETNISGLVSGQLYYIRAYAASEAGVGYGAVITRTTLEVGSNGPAGGIIFYDDGVSGGMEVTVVDYELSMQWGCASLQTNAVSTILGSGITNTEEIVNFHNDLVDYLGNPTQCDALNDGTVAAQYCYDFDHNGYTDWFLPSEEELMAIYTNLHAAGFGDFTDDIYWSSTEVSDIRAKALDLWKGLYLDGNKYTSYKVRPVRKF